MDEALKQKLAEMTQTTAGDEVNKVVNNLAGKLGIAVDRVAPVADKVIQEITIRGFAMAFGLANSVGYCRYRLLDPRSSYV
jgi:hypothetical protein